jgi:transposase
MRLFRRFTSGESQEVVARCPASSPVMALPSKKSLQAAERKRADVARARRRWIREQGFLDPAHLIFIDETAVTTNMVRLNGWNPRGERLLSDAPMGHWETVTFIAGLRQTGIVAPMLIKGAMNGEAFLAYIEQCLVPTLKRRDVVVVDNVPFHKVAGVEDAIQAVGASLRYLPKYSPDLNPIELVFHPLKTFLRKAAQRTIEGAKQIRWLVHSDAQPVRSHGLLQTFWLCTIMIGTRCSALARPMPREAPVTSAVLPFRLGMIIVLVVVASALTQKKC